MNYQELSEKALKIEVALDELVSALKEKEELELFAASAAKAQFILEQVSIALTRIVEEARANSN